MTNTSIPHANGRANARTRFPYQTPQSDYEPVDYTPFPPRQPDDLWLCNQAPSSITLKWHIGGLTFIYTMRDSSDDALFQRIKQVVPKIEARLDAQRQVHNEHKARAQTSDQVQTQSQDDADHWCDLHQVPLKQHSKDGQTWYSHQTDDGTWCRGT
jgi:hypothetical protein